AVFVSPVELVTFSTTEKVPLSGNLKYQRSAAPENLSATSFPVSTWTMRISLSYVLQSEFWVSHSQCSTYSLARSMVSFSLALLQIRGYVGQNVTLSSPPLTAPPLSNTYHNP